MPHPSEAREGEPQIMYPVEHSPLERHTNMAIILPGQDIRKLGMFDKIMEFPAGREVLERGNEYLKNNYGYDLLEMARTIPDETPEQTQARAAILRQSKHTVPAVYLKAMALHNIKKHHEHSPGYNTNPDYLTGISMGMGIAATLAGYMDFETGLYYHAERGRIMQEFGDPTPTSMVTLVGGDREKVREYLALPENASLDLCIINPKDLYVVGGPDNPNDHNSPMQRVRREAKSFGFKKVTNLDTDRAMHGRYVHPAREHIDALLASIKFNKHHSTVVSSITGEPIFNDDEMRQELAEGFDNMIDNTKPIAYFKKRKIHFVSEIASEKGFFAKLLGDHRIQAAAAVGAGALAAGLVTAYEVMTHDHPDHPENGK